MAGGTDRDSGGKRVIQALIIVILIMIVAIEGVLIFFRLPAQRLSRELRLGEKYLDELQYEDAILSFTEAIRISPKSAEAYFNRGLAYEGLADEQANKAAQYPDAEAEKNYGKARKDFQKAAELGYESGDLDAHLTKVRKILTGDADALAGADAGGESHERRRVRASYQAHRRNDVAPWKWLR